MKKFFVLFVKDLKELFKSKTALIFFIPMSLMIGYGLSTAISLYSTQSLSAQGDLVYAQAFEPVRGIFSPAFGGIFVFISLFLPLVIIPTLSLEKQQNTISILLQIPFSPTQIITSKTLSALAFTCAFFLLTLPAIILWHFYGGHIPVGELSLLLTGYFLYAFFTVSVSLCSAALFKNTANAAVFAIILVNASWILDFAAEMTPSPLVHKISECSLTYMLKFFENGIFSFQALLYFITVTTFFLLLSKLFIQVSQKYIIRNIIFVCVLLILTTYIAFSITWNFDLTESKRNSFPKELSETIKKVPPFSIDIYLSPGDSRFKDYKTNILNKLALLRNDIKINFIKGNKLAKNYGLFKYTVNGKSETTYSNSEEEIFPIIFQLARVKEKHISDSSQVYPGYPLVIKNNYSYIYYIYFLIIPLLVLFLSYHKKFRLLYIKFHNKEEI